MAENAWMTALSEAFPDPAEPLPTSAPAAAAEPEDETEREEAEEANEEEDEGEELCTTFAASADFCSPPPVAFEWPFD